VKSTTRVVADAVGECVVAVVPDMYWVYVVVGLEPHKRLDSHLPIRKSDHHNFVVPKSFDLKDK